MGEWIFSVVFTVAFLGFLFAAIGYGLKKGWLPTRDDADDDHRGGLG